MTTQTALVKRILKSLAGDKSKILIVGTEQLKRKRLKNKLAIVVDQDMIEETTSE